jgi:hypothetical protein
MIEYSSVQGIMKTDLSSLNAPSTSLVPVAITSRFSVGGVGLAICNVFQAGKSLASRFAMSVATNIQP